MNRNRWIALGALLAVAALALWWVQSHPGADKARYRTALVEIGYIEMVVSATGTVRPVEQVEVGSQVSGTVSRLYVDYNSRVSSGQVLCQLEPSSFRARVAQADAAVVRAEAALQESRNNLRRARELQRTNVISDVDIETAEVTVQQRQADLKQATAQLEAAQVDLDNSTIKAPINGVVIARSVEVGQTVAASLQAPKLFVIANDLTRMQVETRIDEADIGMIRPDLPVLFTVDAFPEQAFSGSVSQVRLEPITEQNVVTYTTVINTENPELKLRPGMTANVSVRVARRDSVLKVPNSALRFRPPADPKARRPSDRSTPATERRRAETPAPAPVFAAGPPAGTGGVEARFAQAAPQGKADDLGRAELEKRLRERGMPPQAIQGVLERRDQMVEDMRRQGMSDDEIRERLRQRMEQARGGGGSGVENRPSFRDLERKAGGGGGAAPRDAAPGGPRRRLGSGPVVMGSVSEFTYKSGAVYLLRGGQTEKIEVMTGITDGGYTEVRSETLKPGDEVVTGLDTPTSGARLTPPPGMGGSFGPGGGRGGPR